jgi:DNA repair exonuclease SbcCD ATPase subunit
MYRLHFNPAKSQINSFNIPSKNRLLHSTLEFSRKTVDAPYPFAGVKLEVEMEEYQEKSHSTLKWVAIAVVGVLAIVSIVLLTKYITLKHSSGTQVEELKDYVNEVTGVIDSIQTSLDHINPEQQLVQLTGDLNSGQGDKSSIIKRISALEDILNRSQARIQELQDQMNDRDMRIENLNGMLNTLRDRLAKSEKIILAQKGKIDSLRTENANLQTGLAQEREEKSQIQNTLSDVSSQRDQLRGEVASKNEQITRQTREKYTVFYVVGTRKELLKKGIIEEHGKVAFLGGAKQISKAVKDEDFNSLEVANGTTIDVPGKLKKVEVVSAQRKDCYTLQDAGRNGSVLTVTNADRFCQVKYLVIVIN